MSLMGDLLFVIMSCVIVILVFTYIELSLKYKSAKTKLDDLERENLRLKFDVKTLRGDRVVFDPFEYFRNSRPKEIDDDIKDAIKYARDKSHPDNGGLDEDFIKFHQLYQRMCK